MKAAPVTLTVLEWNAVLETAKRAPLTAGDQYALQVIAEKVQAQMPQPPPQDSPAP